MLSRNRLCLLDGKIHHKSLDHLFDLIFLTICSIQLASCVCSKFFDFICMSTPKKLFTTCWSLFTNSTMFCVFTVLQILILLSLCKNFLPILRSSSYS